MLFSSEKGPIWLECFHLFKVIFLPRNGIITTITKPPNKAGFVLHIYPRPCPHADIIFAVSLMPASFGIMLCSLGILSQTNVEFLHSVPNYHFYWLHTIPSN